jgi:hypothetical protein
MINQFFGGVIIRPFGAAFECKTPCGFPVLDDCDQIRLAGENLKPR